VKQFLTALLPFLDCCDGGFALLIEEKVQQLNAVVTDILNRSKLKHTLLSFTDVDLKHIQDVQRTILECTAQANAERIVQIQQAVGTGFEETINSIQELQLELAKVHEKQSAKSLEAEDKELANKAAEILSVLLSSHKHSTAYDLDQASQHIKAGNLDEARKCLERVIQAATSSPPDVLAKARLLLFYTNTRLGIRWLKDHEYVRAAGCFENAQSERPSAISEDRVNSIRLFCACSLYEAGKQALKSGDWGIAEGHFKSCLAKEVLPLKFKSKAGFYLKQCRKNKSSIFRRQKVQTTKTEKFPLGDDTDEKYAADLYKRAKRGKNSWVFYTSCIVVLFGFPTNYTVTQLSRTEMSIKRKFCLARRWMELVWRITSTIEQSCTLIALTT
jgi:TolA-binding protein